MGLERNRDNLVESGMLVRIRDSKYGANRSNMENTASQLKFEIKHTFKDFCIGTNFHSCDCLRRCH